MPVSSAPEQLLGDTKAKKRLCPPDFSWYKTQRPGLWVLPVLSLIVVGVVFIIAGPVYTVFRDEASVSSSRRSSGLFLENNVTTNGCNVDENSTFIDAFLDLTQLTAPQASLRIVGNFQAFGDIVSYNAASTLDLYDNETLVIWVGKSKQKFKKGDLLPKIETTEIMDYAGSQRSYTFYPFDSYVAYPYLMVYIEAVGKNNSTVSTPIPICFGYTNHMPTFDAKKQKQTAMYVPADSESPEKGLYSYVEVEVKFTRTTATRFFSIFIVLLMWAISSFQFVLAIDHLFIRPREILPPTVGFSIAMLFALPAVRNTQPEVPPIGVTVDVLGFFWNMSMASIAATMFMAGLVGYHKYTPMKA